MPDRASGAVRRVVVAAARPGVKSALATRSSRSAHADQRNRRQRLSPASHPHRRMPPPTETAARPPLDPVADFGMTAPAELGRTPANVLDHIGGTPLVRLERIAAGLPVPVLAKCEHLNPGGSVKDRIALAIVDDAEARGVLRAGMTLVEATAGNTGIGLALVAAARGYALVCVMPEKMSLDKRASLAALGAKVVVVPNAPLASPDNFRNVARRLAAENGWFLTDQFCNPANVRVHERTTAAEILEQTRGRIGAFVAGAGTGGTLSGVGRRLKAELPAVRIVLADPLGSALADWVETGVPGADGSYQVEGIGAGEPPRNLHRDVIDGVERVADEESFGMARRLAREEGLLVGGSAGTNVVAALRLAARGDLDGPVVTVLPDAWDRYRTKPWMQNWESLAPGGRETERQMKQARRIAGLKETATPVSPSQHVTATIHDVGSGRRPKNIPLRM